MPGFISMIDVAHQSDGDSFWRSLMGSSVSMCDAIALPGRNGTGSLDPVKVIPGRAAGANPESSHTLRPRRWIPGSVLRTAPD
ncbi:hypothetical protein [Rhodoplanes roseus]|uniref:hypothetical protein n=1 Tax=Rhodoplanes roseus TaxID=29409 RepID=UPI0014755A55|nr:hypothetical protein [Rhodoplanes roseus]